METHDYQLSWLENEMPQTIYIRVSEDTAVLIGYVLSANYQDATCTRQSVSSDPVEIPSLMPGTPVKKGGKDA